MGVGSTIKDRFGRPLTGLRVSVTDRCNLNCFYCHREGCPTSSREMTPEDMGKIVGLAAEFGVRKVKLTGGEPLLRRDIVDVVSSVAKSGMDEVSMTTNGTLLAGIARELKEAGLTRVNISLDTLNPTTFHRITGNGSLPDVLAGVDAAVGAGLSPVKLNMVLLAGVNEHEVEDMISYTSKRGIILQLIELVDANGGDFESYHCGLGRIEQGLKRQAIAVHAREMQARRRYVLPGGEVEVVAPVHNTEFCANCTRLRLTPDGRLKPCLMRNDNLVDILSPVIADNMEMARKSFAEAIARREPYFRCITREICVRGSV